MLSWNDLDQLSLNTETSQNIPRSLCVSCLYLSREKQALVILLCVLSIKNKEY